MALSSTWKFVGKKKAQNLFAPGLDSEKPEKTEKDLQTMYRNAQPGDYSSPLCQSAQISIVMATL